MAYTLRCLQFPNNDLRVPGYEVDAHPTDDPAQVKPYLADPSKQVWDLLFTYAYGQFFHDKDQVPGVDASVVTAWYGLGGPGPSTLTVVPFADGQFLSASNWVQFDHPTATANSCLSETQSVTATVLHELPEYAKVQVTSHSTNTAIVITTYTTHMVFDHFFLIYGTASKLGPNSISVDKGMNCLALAVYTAQTTKSTKTVTTTQLSRIPWWEWQEIFVDVIDSIAAKGYSEVFEHLSPRAIAEADLDVLRKGIADIGKRIEQLEEIKSMIAGLAERKRK